jgi:hypothetical protein
MFYLTNRKQTVLTEGEFFKWLGIRLAMTLQPRRGPMSVYWESKQREGCVEGPLDFGNRYKMTFNRFENILNALTFSDATQSQDPWALIRGIVY